MLVPSALRLLRELHNPSMEKRESYFRGQTVRLAQKGIETLHIPSCCVSLGEEKKRGMQQSLACGYRMSSEIHIIFSVWLADGFPGPLNRALMVEWENAEWMQELAQWRPSLSPGHSFQGFVQMRAEQAWRSAGAFQIPVCLCVSVQVCACRRTCPRGIVDLVLFPVENKMLYSEWLRKAKEKSFEDCFQDCYQKFSK